MFSVERLLQLGLFNQVIPMWQVFFFIATLVPFLLLNRVKTCLFLVYLFTFYLGFIVQWGDYLASAGALGPFVVYALSGMIVSILFVLLVFRDEGLQLNLHRKKASTLQRFDLDDSI